MEFEAVLLDVGIVPKSTPRSSMMSTISTTVPGAVASITGEVEKVTELARKNEFCVLSPQLGSAVIRISLLPVGQVD